MERGTWVLGRAALNARGDSVPRKRVAAGLAGFALVLAACSPSSETPRAGGSSELPDQQSRAPVSSSSEGSYRAELDPGHFVRDVDNPYFPLEVGTVFRYEGKTEDGVERETVTVTDQTKEIEGIKATVVEDAVRLHGELTEYTHDWYAQDAEGNVWYLGEKTAEYEDGKVTSRSGSWEAGVDGAQAGIIMGAHPAVTESHHQEYYKGEAEDMYWTVATDESVRTPTGRYDDVIRTLEWSPLEPKVVGQKMYAPGVGLVSERALSGSLEVFHLESVSHEDGG